MSVAAAALALPAQAGPPPAKPRSTSPSPDATPLTPADGQILLRLLEGAPYAAQGRGRVLYTRMSSSCSYCQLFSRDYPSGPPGVELRRLPFPAKGASSRATLQVMRDRSPAAFDSYMRRRAGEDPRPLDNNPDIDLMNLLIRHTQAVNTLLQRQSPPQRTGTPTWFFEHNGRMYADMGYDRAMFAAFHRAFVA